MDTVERAIHPICTQFLLHRQALSGAHSGRGRGNGLQDTGSQLQEQATLSDDDTQMPFSESSVGTDAAYGLLAMLLRFSCDRRAMWGLKRSPPYLKVSPSNQGMISERLQPPNYFLSKDSEHRSKFRKIFLVVRVDN